MVKAGTNQPSRTSMRVCLSEIVRGNSMSFQLIFGMQITRGDARSRLDIPCHALM